MKWRDFEREIDSVFPKATESDDYAPLVLAKQDHEYVDKYERARDTKDRVSASFRTGTVAVVVTFVLHDKAWYVAFDTLERRHVSSGNATTLRAAACTALTYLQTNVEADKASANRDEGNCKHLALLIGDQ